MRGGALRRDWRAPVLRLETEPQSYPTWKVREVMAYADWFIRKWAEWAELAGMQPVHLLRHSREDEAGRGLAWRAKDLSLTCFPCRYHALFEGKAHYFLYRFDMDGRTVMVAGEVYADIIGDHLELIKKPAVREAIIRAE